MPMGYNSEMEQCKVVMKQNLMYGGCVATLNVAIRTLGWQSITVVC